MNSTNNKGTWLRWLTLVFVLLNISFNYFYDSLTGVPTIREASDNYYNLFTPAPYAFSIWGLIYFSFTMYCVYQLRKEQRGQSVYDDLSAPLLRVNIIASVWIWAFTAGLTWFSVFLILCMLLLGIIMFVRAKRAVLSQSYSYWLMVPFSLFLGWISVAVIANVAAALTDAGWQGGGLSETNWSIGMIVVAFLLGIIISVRFRDWIYPLVICWAVAAIWVENRGRNESVAMAGMFAAFSLLIISLAVMVSNGSRRKIPVMDVKFKTD